jgi:hypothetical protein
MRKAFSVYCLKETGADMPVNLYCRTNYFF